jgi:hypothetical protein
MNITTSFWTKLSAKIIALFVTAMVISFIPDHIHSFLGDIWHMNKDSSCTELLSLYSPGEYHWDWGWRHYLWTTMCICLFAVQAMNIITWTDKTIK